jgi:hypothetical protein
MITPPPVSGLRTKGSTPPNPEPAAPVPDAGNTLPSTQEDGGASTHIARLRDRRSRAQLALAFDPKPIAGRLTSLACAHGGADDADAATGGSTNADPRWLEPGMADIAVHLKVAYAKPDAVETKLAEMAPSIDLAISTVPGHAPDHGDITVLLRACDEPIRAKLPAELRSPQFKREDILVRTYQIRKQLVQMVKPDIRGSHELLRAIAASYVAAQHQLSKAELQSLLPTMHHSKAAEFLLNVIRVNGVEGLKFMHAFDNYLSTAKQATKPSSANHYRLLCVRLMRSGEELFANHGAYKTQQDRAYGWVNNPADTESVLEHSIEALQHNPHKTKKQPARKCRSGMSQDEHQETKTESYRSQFWTVVRHMQAAAAPGFSSKIPEITVAPSSTPFAANATENADQNTHTGSTHDPVMTSADPIENPGSLTEYGSVKEMPDAQNMAAQIFPNEWGSRLGASPHPNADAQAFFEETLELFHSDGLALGEAFKGGENFGAEHAQWPPAAQVRTHTNSVDRHSGSAQIHTPHNPDQPAEVSCEIQPIREPRTPDMLKFCDVNYPNKTVTEDSVAKTNAAFSEAMVHAGLSFGEERMHPLLNKLCQEIKTELGLEMQHPRLRSYFASLLASRLKKALHELFAPTLLKDLSPYNKNQITTILNIRAYTYIAALLDFSGKKQEQEKGEFHILRDKMGAGSDDAQLTKFIAIFGAQGLHILEDLTQMLGHKRVAKGSIKQYINSASILMCKAQDLFETEPGKMPNWVKDTERVEQVIAVAIADIKSRKNSTGAQSQIDLARKRSRFTSCLPHLREVLVAASARVSIRDSHFENGRDFVPPSIGDKRTAAQAFPSRP